MPISTSAVHAEVLFKWSQPIKTDNGTPTMVPKTTNVRKCGKMFSSIGISFIAK
jgi:hypothetical protein